LVRTYLFGLLVKPVDLKSTAHAFGYWYHDQYAKDLAIKQLHDFIYLVWFPAFVHAPPVLRSFGFPKEIAAQPPLILACFLFKTIITPLRVVTRFGVNAIRRNFVWQADRFAAELLVKLHDEKMSDMGDRLGRVLITLGAKNLGIISFDWLYVFPSTL
jgi:STE24 endopeptidase